MKKFIIKSLIILSIISVFAILILISLYYFLPDYLNNTIHTEEITIRIEEGGNLHRVSESLEDRGVIRNSMWFRFIGSRNDLDTRVRPGTYVIPTDINILGIYEIFQEGEADEQISITIPEGFTLYRTALRFEERGIMSKDDFFSGLYQYKEINNIKVPNEEKLIFPLEGYLYPDTYNFNERQSPLEIITIMAEKMNSIFTDEIKESMDSLNLTKHEVLTMAALIERETSFSKESPKISGVIYNRLEIGMLLQIDASVIYGVGEGIKHLDVVLYRDLESNSPFNTYKFPGLPPGPIAAPGKTSILAALNPEEHNYLYYVLGEDGHVFAKTYDEHLINVQNYRDLQRGD